MCRNIRPLFNFEPPASEDEVRAAALQFVRKISGFNAPSQANAPAFDRAVAEVRRRPPPPRLPRHTPHPATARRKPKRRGRALGAVG
jgi:hypothetical protein